MKTVLITNVFITDENTEKMVYENIVQLKKFGYPILVTANFLSERIQKIIDHCFIFKENLLFKNDYKHYHWVTHYAYYAGFQIQSTHPDKQIHGLAVMHALYKAASLADLLGYEYIVVQEWDNFFGDEDINKLKKLHQKLFENKEKSALVFSHDHEFYEKTCHIFATLIFKTKYFVNKFPYFSSEDDYVKFANVNKLYKFVPYEKLLHICFIENNKNEIFDLNHNEDFKLTDKNTFLNRNCNSLNWPKPCTKTTKKMFCKSNQENVYYCFSENISYENKNNPNWQIINYDIITQKNKINISHNINTGCWSLSSPIQLTPTDFPIKVIVDNQEFDYRDANEIYNTLFL